MATKPKRTDKRPRVAVGIGVLALVGASLAGPALELLAEAARVTTTDALG